MRYPAWPPPRRDHARRGEGRLSLRAARNPREDPSTMPRIGTIAVQLAATAALALGAAVYGGLRLTAWQPNSVTTNGAAPVRPALAPILASAKGGMADQRSPAGKPYAVFCG